jgi:predicted nucleic acid-binding Zn finger protein
MKTMALSLTEVKRLSGDSLTQGDIEYFRNKYGKRFVRALRVVEERRVLKYQFHPSDTIVWTVKGRTRQYMVIPRVYCTCRSFYQDVVISREINMCYHLLAQQIAEIRQSFDTIQSTDSERRKMFIEWRRTD